MNPSIIGTLAMLFLPPLYTPILTPPYLYGKQCFFNKKNIFYEQCYEQYHEQQYLVNNIREQ